MGRYKTTENIGTSFHASRSVPVLYSRSSCLRNQQIEISRCDFAEFPSHRQKLASWPTWPLQAGAGRSPAKKKMLTAHVLNQSINPGERPETKEQLLASSPLRPGGAPAIVPVRTAPDTSSPADLARLWLAGSCGRATALRSHRGVWRMGGGRRRAGAGGAGGAWPVGSRPESTIRAALIDF